MDCSTGNKTEETSGVAVTESSENETKVTESQGSDNAETITLWKADPESLEKPETVLSNPEIDNEEQQQQISNSPPASVITSTASRQHRNVIRSGSDKEHAAESPRQQYQNNNNYTPPLQQQNNNELDDHPQQPPPPPYQPPQVYNTPNPSPSSQNYHLEQQNQHYIHNSDQQQQQSPPSHSQSVVVQNMHHVPPLLTYEALKYEEDMQINGSSPPPPQNPLLTNSTYATLEPVHLQPQPSYSPPNSSQYINTTTANSAGYYYSYPKASNDPLYVKTDPNLSSATSKLALQHHYDPALSYDDSPQYNYNRAIVTSTEAYWLPSNGTNMVEYSTPTPPGAGSYSGASSHHHHHHLALASQPLTLPGEATLELRPSSVAGSGGGFGGQMSGQGHTHHWINAGGLSDDLYDPGKTQYQQTLLFYLYI